MNSNGNRAVMEEFRRRKKIQALKNRRWFLQRCIAEQVIPRSAPKLIKRTQGHPFPASARAFLMEARDRLGAEITILQAQRNEGLNPPCAQLGATEGDLDLPHSRTVEGHNAPHAPVEEGLNLPPGSTEDGLYQPGSQAGHVSNASRLHTRVGLNLPHCLISRLKRVNQRHIDSLSRNLENLCRHSDWSTAGSEDLVINISSKPLSPTELQALSLGLKFDTGSDKRPLSYYLSRSRLPGASDVDKGFAQGVITTMHCLKTIQAPTLPSRFVEALRKLGEDDSLHITQDDKGGGVVVMDKATYLTKMSEILHDEATYS